MERVQVAHRYSHLDGSDGEDPQDEEQYEDAVEEQKGSTEGAREASENAECMSPCIAEPPVEGKSHVEELEDIGGRTMNVSSPLRVFSDAVGEKEPHVAESIREIGVKRLPTKKNTCRKFGSVVVTSTSMET